MQSGIARNITGDGESASGPPPKEPMYIACNQLVTDVINIVSPIFTRLG